MNGYCIYLRKSRADAEAEMRGEGETLARHRNMLTELAEKQGLNIVKTYKEIVSGDSIAARPQMQALLADVAERKYTGVLVVEIERLARGDTIDQGIVAQAFRDSSTKIVTPAKTYDPNNEFDEEYFEFSLFMSRREFKTIKRRMQAGRLASVKEGNYICTSPPYGYRKINPQPKVHTLEIVPEEAEVIRLIYRLYLEGHGAKYIANELDSMGISPQKSRFWEPSSIRKILSNPLYCGMIGWKTRSNGNKLYKGLHEPVITEEMFDSVQIKRKTAPAPQLHTNDKLMNYYHNVLYCQNCGHQMKRRHITGSSREYMLCVHRECRGKVVSSSAEAVDEAVLSALRYRISKLERLKRCSGEVRNDIPDKKIILAAELEKAERQLSRLYDLLEQGIYDTDVFLERSRKAGDRIRSLKAAVKETESETRLPQPHQDDAVIELKYAINNFAYSGAEEKNRLLNAAVSKIFYRKNEKMCKNRTDSALSLTAFFL